MAVSDVPVFMQGNGAPVLEERTLTDLEVTGSLPPELDGRYVRNGGNPHAGPIDHPFLGDGMVHGVRLRDGSGRVVPQPLREDAVPHRQRARRRRRRDDDRHGELEGQHPRHSVTPAGRWRWRRATSRTASTTSSRRSARSTSAGS